MKKLIYIIVLILIFIACYRNGVRERLSEIDSLVTHEQYDSADIIMSKIDTAQLKDKEDKAHYYLLRTQLACVLHKGDSTNMLNDVITYYLKNQNHVSLANAYYYKGYQKLLKGDVVEAITYYKKAEEQAKVTDNSKLQYKIAESLTYTNEITGNYQLELYYAKKALAYVQSINNKKWEADALFIIGLAYSRLNQKDSMFYYLNKLEPLLKYIPQNDLPAFLINVAYLYKHRQPEKAKHFLLKSLSIKETSSTLEHLADIYYDEGHHEEAYRTWKRALAVNDKNPKDIIIHNLLEYDIEHGKTDNICQQVNEIIAIKDSVIDKLKNDTIKDLQLHFDHEVAMRKQEQETNRWQKGLLATILLVTVLVAYIIIYRYKEKNKLHESQMQINDLVEQIRELETSGERDSEAIEKLNSQLENTMNKEGRKLKEGKMLYDQIDSGGSAFLWKRREINLFINYYTAINYKKVNRLKNTKRKEKLTPYQLFFLILREMGYNKKKIAEILSIKETSVNTLISRTKPIE